MRISSQIETAERLKLNRTLISSGVIAGICTFANAAFSQTLEAPFDAPLRVDATEMPVNADEPDLKPKLNCYEFKEFSVHEIVDPNEIGAKSLTVTSTDAPCDKLANDDLVIADDYAGYFMGAKGKFVFFKASDYMNSGQPFVVFDASQWRAKSVVRAFSDSVEDGKFQSIVVDANSVTIHYRRSFDAGCSLYADGDKCVAKVKEATGLTVLPACEPIYQAAIKEWPQYAADLAKVSSILNYEATLVYGGKSVSIKPQADAKSACHMPA